MRRAQKILGGIFLTGVLIGGVGTGIAMVEYSSLTYGGEKLIGEDSLVTKTLDFEFEPDGRILEVAGGRFWGRDRTQEIEIDNTVPMGTIRFQVTYNEKTVTPELGFEPYEEEEMIWEDPQDIGIEEEGEPGPDAEPEFMDGEEYEGEYGEEYTDEYRDSSQTPEEEELAAEPGEEKVGQQAQDESKPGKMGTVWLTASYHERSFSILMENKDYMLEELKEGKISSYDVAYITDVKIKINQETMPYIESLYVMH